ncbi:hypothetical protein AeMF1_004880 [Aphanomyces euteiches]|nr:hypothetical protein AeMF1_004880 [Aphanomyces euteiches]KAH9183320.1 hypothetical protein AeNC1_014704 [Aphanomyces euteiches]
MSTTTTTPLLSPKHSDKEDPLKEEIRPSSPALVTPESSTTTSESNQESPPVSRTASLDGTSHDKIRASSTPETPPVAIPLPKDPIEDEYDIVINETLPMGLDFVFTTLWREDQFTIDGLTRVGETNIAVTKWTDQPVTYTAFDRAETFESSRTVSFTHNKKNFIGPSSIPTIQINRYNYVPGQRLVVSVTSSVHDAPFCDYFRAESRWVFNYESDSSCKLISGMRLKWVKSTILKGQIENFGKSESKSVMLKWVKQAMEAYKKSRGEMPVVPVQPIAPPVEVTATTPESSLLFLRKANIVCLCVLVVLLAQVFATLQTVRSSHVESIRLQKQHQALVSQLMDKMKCMKQA